MVMEMNYEGIAEFLSLGYVLNDGSFRKGKKAPIEVKKPSLKTFDATTDDVKVALEKTMEHSVKAGQKVGVLLSGGKDARLLAALATDLGFDVTAVNVGDAANRDEEKAAKKVATTLDIPFKVVLLPDQVSPDLVSNIRKVTDGVLSFSSITPIYLIRDQLAKDFDVVFTGNLMTEIMDTCETRWYDSDKALEVMTRKHMKGTRVLKPEFRDGVKQRFEKRYESKTLEEIILDTEYKNRYRCILALNKLCDVSIVTPAADKDVVNATFSLPLEQRINGRLATSIMKKEYPKVARVRSSKTILPLSFPWWMHYGTHRVKDKIRFYMNGRKIWNGKPRTAKMGMWDQGYLYKYKLGEYVKNSIESLDLDILDTGFVHQLLEEHFTEQRDHSGYIPRLVTIKDWLDHST